MVGKKGIAPAAIVLLLLVGIPLGMYVADVPITKVQVGNETITVTTRDLILRITAPMRHGVENALIHMNPQAKAALETDIERVYDEFIAALNDKILTLDVVQERWPEIVSVVKEYNLNTTGESVPYVVLCVFKGPVEVCKTFKLNEEEPRIELIQENVTKTYLTIKIPYGTAIAVIQELAYNRLENAFQVMVKAAIRGDIEAPVRIMERFRARVKVGEPFHLPRHHIPEVPAPR